MQLEKASIALVIQGAVLLVLTGCTGVNSTHPASQLAESEPVPEHLLGSWQVVEMFGEPSDPLPEVVVSQGAAGTLGFLMRHGSQTMWEGEASLTTLQGQTVVSLQAGGGPEESWLLLRLVVDEESQLNVVALSHPEVIEDIDQGLVEGRVFRFDSHDWAALSASPEQLRAYIASQQDAFAEPLMVLRKQGP